jgi:hypothetical protein
MEFRASKELKIAREFALKGNTPKAALHYFRALNFYSPIGSSQTAAKELYDLALDLDKKGQKKEAYLAFLRLRAALNASRSFYTPRKDLLDGANKQISAYLALLHQTEENDQNLNYDETYKYYYSLYSKNPPANEFWYFLTVLGFLMWTLGAIKSIFKIFVPSKSTNTILNKLKRAKIPLCIFILGYIMWILGMTNA